MIKATLIFAFLISVLAGCVTVTLDNSGKGKRAEGVALKDPSSPFQKDLREEVDSAWKNPKNGNVISYLSDCKDPADPPLKQIVQGVLEGLTDLKIESEESPTHQGREARRVTAWGKVDGVPTGIELLVFKRNTCTYILTYVGVKKYFAENNADFNRFVESFRAP
jgi:hypothetical protein